MSSGSSSVGSAAASDEAAGSYLRAVSRHWLLVVVVTVVAVAAALYWSSGRARTYQSSASVLVSPVPQGDSTYIGTGVVIDTLDPARTVQTAAALLDTRDAAAAAARRMGSGWTAGRVQAAVSVTPRGGSNVLAVTATAPTAAQAASLANRFAAAAVANRARIVQQNVATQLRVLQRRLSQLSGAASASAQGVEISTRVAQLHAVQDTGRDPTLTVSQLAQAPTGPTGASTSLIVLLAGVAGLAIGCVAALLVDSAQPAVRDENEVMSLFPAPILATIPKASRFKRRGRLTPLSLPPAAFEQIRLLRAQIPKRVVMITSADIGDGKTTVATALAAALAEVEQDVVLLDLDLRNPAVGKVFEVDAADRELLVHEYATLRESLVSVPQFPHLKILPARPGDISTFESLIARLPALLTEAERLGEWVILDTPGLGEVGDALRVADECKPAVIMVARLGHTDRSKLALAHELLNRAEATTVGTVVFGQRGATLRGSSYGYGYTRPSAPRAEIAPRPKVAESGRSVPGGT